MRTIPLILALVLLASPSAHGGWFGADFSAEAVQMRPGQAPMSSRMYVSQGKLRTEFEKEGRHMVEILDPKARRGLLLFPQQQAYMERELPPSRVNDGNNPDPCSELPPQQAHCESLGEEELNGRLARKWRIGNAEGERLEWLDARHHFPVRQELIVEGEPQLRFERRHLGEEAVSGRNCEKWEMVMMGEQGDAIRSLQWYDPELNIALRQELPGGFVRELRNLSIAPQPAELFTLPGGYRLLPPPSLAAPAGR